MLEAFLRCIADEAGKGLAPAEVEVLVCEARDHLEESIQARLELGVSLEEAEREAIAAFGSAQALGGEIRRREPRVDRAFFLSALSIIGFFAWAGGPRAFLGWTYLAMVGLALLVHAAFLVASARAKRPQWRVFAMLLLPLWLGTAGLNAMREVTIFGVPNVEGPAPYPRSIVPGAIEQFRQDARRAWERPSALVQGYARYLRGESDLVPGASLYAADGRLRLHAEPDRAKGEKDWRQAVVGGVRLSTASVMRDNALAEALERQGDRPWWTELPYQVVPAADRLGLLSILAIYGGGHLLFWAFGRSLRRRRRRGGLRA